jgi:hypothetical protein
MLENIVLEMQMQPFFASCVASTQPLVLMLTWRMFASKYGEVSCNSGKKCAFMSESALLQFESTLSKCVQSAYKVHTKCIQSAYKPKAQSRVQKARFLESKAHFAITKRTTASIF